MLSTFLNSILQSAHKLGSNSTPNKLARVCFIFKQIT